jgi:hypothetical protein
LLIDLNQQSAFENQQSALSARELPLGFQPILERRSAMSVARFVDLVCEPGDFLLGDLNGDN